MSEKEPGKRSQSQLLASEHYRPEQADITWLERCAESVYPLFVVLSGRVGRLTITQVLKGIWLTNHHHLRGLPTADLSMESALAQCTIQTKPPISLDRARYTRWYPPHERAHIYQPWEDFLVIAPQQSIGVPLPEEALASTDYKMNQSFPCALIAYPEGHDLKSKPVISTGEGVYVGDAVIAVLEVGKGCSGGPLFDFEKHQLMGIIAREDRYVKGGFWGPSIGMTRPYLQQLLE